MGDQVVEPEAAGAGNGEHQAQQPDRYHRLRAGVVGRVERRRVDKHPGAEHVERHQHADGPHCQAEDQGDTADRLEQQVRRPGERGQRDPGLLEEPADAGDAAAVA